MQAILSTIRVATETTMVLSVESIQYRTNQQSEVELLKLGLFGILMAAMVAVTSMFSLAWLPAEQWWPAVANATEMNPAPLPAPTQSEGVDMAAAQASNDTLNGYRLSAGVSALPTDPQLTALAMWKAQDMAGRGYFGHVDPSGQMIFAYAQAGGIGYSAMGENLGKATAGNNVGTVQSLIATMMAEQPGADGHKVNILNPGWSSVGSGAYYKNGQVYLVQLFRA
jgi:uncharacterized protein YkwD